MYYFPFIYIIFISSVPLCDSYRIHFIKLMPIIPFKWLLSKFSSNTLDDFDYFEKVKSISLIAILLHYLHFCTCMIFEKSKSFHYVTFLSFLRIFFRQYIMKIISSGIMSISVFTHTVLTVSKMKRKV